MRRSVDPLVVSWMNEREKGGVRPRQGRAGPQATGPFAAADLARLGQNECLVGLAVWLRPLQAGRQTGCEN